MFPFQTLNFSPSNELTGNKQILHTSIQAKRNVLVDKGNKKEAVGKKEYDNDKKIKL